MQKLSQFAQELKSNLINDNIDTLAHASSRNIKYMAIDSQVCFHRWFFANPVKPSWCITGPVEPLGCTNQNRCGIKLLPMSTSTYPVDYIHLCHLLRAQHYCLCSNGREDPPLACPPTPTTFCPLIHDTHDITGVVKKLSQKPAVTTAQQS